MVAMEWIKRHDLIPGHRLTWRTPHYQWRQCQRLPSGRLAGRQLHLTHVQAASPTQMVHQWRKTHRKLRYQNSTSRGRWWPLHSKIEAEISAETATFRSRPCGTQMYRQYLLRVLHLYSSHLSGTGTRRKSPRKKKNKQYEYYLFEISFVGKQEWKWCPFLRCR